MRRHLWVLGLAALAGVIASFLIVDANYFLGAIMGAVSGVFVVLFIRAWPMDLDPRVSAANRRPEINGGLILEIRSRLRPMGTLLMLCPCEYP